MSLENAPRKLVRRRHLADHFGVNIRTVDAWARRGVIPPPQYLEGSEIPFWFADETIALPLTRKSEKSAP
jgi:hypothetical protein